MALKWKGNLIVFIPFNATHIKMILPNYLPSQTEMHFKQNDSKR